MPGSYEKFISFSLSETGGFKTCLNIIKKFIFLGIITANNFLQNDAINTLTNIMHIHAIHVLTECTVGPKGANKTKVN